MAKITMAGVPPFTTAPADEMTVPMLAFRQPDVHPESEAYNFAGAGGGVPDTPVTHD